MQTFFVAVLIVRKLLDIQELVTNEHVQEMVRSTLQDDSLKSRLKEAFFEPKMTRSKLKEVIEKGQVMTQRQRQLRLLFIHV